MMFLDWKAVEGEGCYGETSAGWVDAGGGAYLTHQNMLVWFVEYSQFGGSPQLKPGLMAMLVLVGFGLLNETAADLTNLVVGVLIS